MATEVIRADAEQSRATPHGRGVLDRILAFIDWLPGPTAAWWVGIGLISQSQGTWWSG